MPNPAKSQVKFVFHLDTVAKIKIEAYNLVGEKVASLSDDFPAGKGLSLAWDLKNTAASVYLARMLVDGQEKAKPKVAVTK